MEFIDYYKVLGVDKSATTDDIKKAFRKAAKKSHPDLHPNDKGATKKFQHLNEANEVLSDSVKRKKYDEYGKDWQHAEHYDRAKQQRQSYSPGGQSYTSDFEGSDFSDFFSSMFGGGGSGSRGNSRQVKYKGQDIQSSMNLTLEEVYTTQQKTFAVNNKKIRITIPAGVEDGQVIKLKEYGGEGMNGGPVGDLYITYIIQPHAKYTRIGNDLMMTENLNLYTALLGGEITIDIFGTVIKLKIKPETQNGTKTRLKGKGLPVYKSSDQFGDLYITFNVLLPTNLTDKQKELFSEIAQL